MAGEYLPPVVTELTGNIDDLIAKINEAKAAMDSLKGMSGTIPINFEVNTASLARARTYARQLQAAMPPQNIPINFDVNTASFAKAAAATAALDAAQTRAANPARWVTWLHTAHMVLTVFGANIVADTIGLVAFGIGATTAIAPVITALTGLGATYGYLSPVQQAATVRLNNFINGFRNANQTGIFAVFNGLMDLVQQHIGKTGGIMGQATIAFQNFAAMLRQTFSSAPWEAMLGRSTGVIQTDLTALFHLIQSILGVLPALLHDFNSWGLFAINAAAGLLHLVAIIGNANPTLAKFAVGALAVYRILRMIGLFNPTSGLRNFIANLTTGVSGGLKATAASGAAAEAAIVGTGAAAGVAAGDMGFLAKTIYSVKTFGLGTTAFLLTGLTPGALVAAGAVTALAGAEVYLILNQKLMVGGMARVIQGLQQQDNATGSNLAGYQRLTSQLHSYVVGTTQLSAAQKAANATGFARTQAIMALNSAYQQASARTQTLRSNLQYLEQTYGITQRQAYQLAQATGTNLTQAFAKGGGAAQLSRIKIQQYEQTVQAAANPTSTLAYDLGLASNMALQLDDRVTALTNAFNALATPFANVIQATVTWKQGNLTLESAVDKANGKVNALGTTTQRYAASQLATAITNTIALSTATLQQTGSMTKAIGPVRAEITVLQALGSKSAVVAQAIKTLEAYIASLHSKTITITTIMQTLHQNGNSAPTRPGFAAGTGSAPRGWAWVGEQGPELMYFRGGEKVKSHSDSVAVAARGFAGGTGDAGGQLQPIVIQLNGKTLYKAMAQLTYYKNGQNNVRNTRGGVVGRMGTR